MKQLNIKRIFKRLFPKEWFKVRIHKNLEPDSYGSLQLSIWIHHIHIYIGLAGFNKEPIPNDPRMLNVQDPIYFHSVPVKKLDRRHDYSRVFQENPTGSETDMYAVELQRMLKVIKERDNE